MLTILRTPATVTNLMAPVVVALILIALFSLLREPARQRFSAIFVSGAGAAYFSAGLGPWEQVFCVVITLLAWRGLYDYRAIGLAWLLHSGWDFVHDVWGNPILPFVPNSSFGCMICDPVLALWYFLGAPSLWHRVLRTRGALSHAADNSASIRELQEAVVGYEEPGQRIER